MNMEQRGGSAIVIIRGKIGFTAILLLSDIFNRLLKNLIVVFAIKTTPLISGQNTAISPYMIIA